MSKHIINYKAYIKVKAKDKAAKNCPQWSLDLDQAERTKPIYV